MKPKPERLPALSATKPSLTASPVKIKTTLSLKESLLLDAAMPEIHISFDLEHHTEACRAFHRRQAELRSRN